MRPPADEHAGLSTRPAPPPASGTGDFPSEAGPTAVEQDANAAADEQAILHLKTLFESDPARISSLLEGTADNQPATYAATLMTAAREALAARPDSADLYYHAARAAIRLGRMREAAELLEHALERDPRHGPASALLSDVCMLLKEPQRAMAWLRRTLALGTASTPPRPAKRRNRRGNELFT
jgi:tetratricopeptide (TPR) repeat protein